SYAGTCWAVMALLTATPETPEPAHGNAGIAGTAAPWVRTALLGTAGELTSLLDSGLDANSKTPNNTSLLMMAADDAEKNRLLIARGADARVRGASGSDALTIAATYRGTGRSIQLLLDAGANVQPPDGVRVKHTPLAFAAMTGDLQNVQLLLKGGAAPSADS